MNQKTNFEVDIIVIDDASTDESKTILEDYQTRFPEKITLLFNDHNLGITKTWIKACLYAKGKYILKGAMETIIGQMI